MISHRKFWSVPPLLEAVEPVLQSCNEIISRLAFIVPENQFWRWKDMWTNSLRTAIFTVVMIGYLTQRDLISLQGVSDIFGCKGSFQVLFGLKRLLMQSKPSGLIA